MANPSGELYQMMAARNSPRLDMYGQSVMTPPGQSRPMMVPQPGTQDSMMYQPMYQPTRSPYQGYHGDVVLGAVQLPPSYIPMSLPRVPSQVPLAPSPGQMMSHQSVSSPQQQAVSPQQPLSSPHHQIGSPQQPINSPKLELQHVPSPKLPLASPKQPMASPHRQLSSPQQTLMSPQQPIASPQQPMMSPQQPLASPQQPMLSPQQPMMSPQQPLMSPQQSLASPQQPPMSPQQPYASPHQPITYHQQSFSLSQHPYASPQRPLASPQQPIASPKQQITSPKMQRPRPRPTSLGLVPRTVPGFSRISPAIDSKASMEEVQSVLHQLLQQHQDEGRRHLMMEQDDLKDSDLPKGVIDVTSLSSPGPAHSSGYCSADEDHSYSSSKGGTPVLDTPGSPHDDRLPDFSTDTLSLFDMIGDMLPPQTSAALAGSTESWMAGLDTDIEMLDMDPDPVTAGAGDGLMSTLLKETDKALLHQTKAGGFGTAPGLSMMVPSTSAVITQSNVMLSSTTYQNGLQADTTVTKPGLTQMVSSNLDNQPVSLPISLATNLAMANPKANISVAAFPPGMLGADPDAGITDNNNDFALKYAENVVDQQINATLANYFGDNDTLMDSSDLGVQDAPMNGLNDLLLEDTSTLSSFLTATSTPSNSQPAVAPTCSAYQPVTPRTPAASKPDNTVFVVPRNPPPVSSHNIVNGHSARTTSQHHHQQRSSSHKVTLSRQNSSSSSSSSHHKSSSSSQQQHFPGLDDHRYTSKQLDSPPHKPAANRHHKSNSYRQPVSQPPSHPGPNSHPLLLERFLLTKEKLNPNKGSEAALATKAISELHLGDRGDGSLDGMLGDGNQQLLKKLLTEELHPKDLAKAQQEVIQDRRHSAGSATPPTTDHDDHMAAITGAFSLDTDDLTQSITLLGEDHSAEMDKLWAPPGGDVAIPSELDEILKEEMRQNDLWLQHCINELL